MLRRWYLVVVALLVWAALVVLWSTGPYLCETPGKDYKGVCYR